MVRLERSLWVGGVGAAFLWASAGFAQDSNTVIGPPQLRDFSLPVQERIVNQPQPAPEQAPVRVAPPPPVTTQPRQTTPARQTTPPPAQTRPAPTTTRPAPQPQPTTPAPTNLPPATTTAPPPSATTPPLESAPLPDQSPPPISVPAPAPAEETSKGWPIWLYGLPVALLALIGAALLMRRRRRDEEGYAGEDAPASAAAPAAPSKPRPDPAARPWIELELRTERAAFTATEANVAFELEIRNTGKSAARNLRIDVKMFNGGAEQDKEIGAFFRTAGRETTRLKLPAIAAETTGVIKGEVGLKREEMRALQLDDRTLFIPVVAVNALYDWAEARTGQSSKSYVIGRELQTPSEKMGAFRLDQGPRIWRTVGQRQHKLARRM